MCEGELETIPEEEVLRAEEKLVLRADRLEVEARRLAAEQKRSANQALVNATVLKSVEERRRHVEAQRVAAQAAVTLTAGDVVSAKTDFTSRESGAGSRPPSSLKLRKALSGAVVVVDTPVSVVKAAPSSMFVKSRGPPLFLSKQRQVVPPPIVRHNSLHSLRQSPSPK